VCFLVSELLQQLFELIAVAVNVPDESGFVDSFWIYEGYAASTRLGASPHKRKLSDVELPLASFVADRRGILHDGADGDYLGARLRILCVVVSRSS
jgi:hypothetical protein